MGQMKAILCVSVCAVLLSGCATFDAAINQMPAPKTAADTEAAQNVVFVVGDNPASNAVQPEVAQGDALSLKHVYWYFAGR